MKHVGERKAVLVAEGNIQAIVGSGGLQFEIERAAEAFSKREAPGLIDAAAERGMDHELHASAFVEEALGDHGVLGGNGAQDGAAGDNIFDRLLRSRAVETAFLLQPIYGGVSLWQRAAHKARRNSFGKRADFFPYFGN